MAIAFTPAHSITLSLAALAVIQLPQRLIEPVNALNASVWLSEQCLSHGCLRADRGGSSSRGVL